MKPPNAPVEGRAMPGGVSSDVMIVDGPDGPFVVKRALPRLKVDADWRSDPRRSGIEVACLREMADLLGQETVPRVLWANEAEHSFAMECIDARLVNWKQRLLDGDIDPATARRAGTLLGQFHARSAARGHLAVRFDDRQFLMELRVTPYHRRIAERHGDIAPVIESVVARMLETRISLVHGDYSPKNMLVDGADVVVLDCEVAHWGDPRFDLGFCLSHLALKLIRDGGHTDALAACAQAYLAGYAEEGMDIMDAEACRQTGCLMLARIDGDSPVEYLPEEPRRECARAAARSLIVDPPSDMTQVVSRTQELLP